MILRLSPGFPLAFSLRYKVLYMTQAARSSSSKMCLPLSLISKNNSPKLPPSSRFSSLRAGSGQVPWAPTGALPGYL